MVDRNNFIKNSLDNELKDIYVTEDLKLRTLSRIKKEDNNVVKPFKKPFRRKSKFSYASMRGLALVSSILIMFFTFSFFKYSKFMNSGSLGKNTDNNEKNIVLDDNEKVKKPDNLKDKSDTDKKEEIKDIKDEKINEEKLKEDVVDNSKNNSNTNEVDNSPTNKENKKPIKNEKNPNKEKPKNNEEKEKPKLTEKEMLARAEKLWGGKINLPSYIPKGYDVANIDMETAYGSKVLKITYKNPNSDNFLELKVLDGDKTAFENGDGSKNPKEDEKNKDNNQDVPKDNVDKPTPTEEIKSINSNKNGVEYNIEGNIPTKTLEKIAESIE
ncbi:DUF4367 domain-containing protein [Clostridium cochlearium]|uniref:DUF4367 domain-containing protein n=1 Tax=Clostridium cochlearium TaxID=1494 RepID=UPI001C0EF32A|nr:DUF4367 domain-containing protein [Clostridium cochlearium]MBU5270331.1 DUF4367 domain-containing protein [Clostridium cochlearium]